MGGVLTETFGPGHLLHTPSSHLQREKHRAEMLSNLKKRLSRKGRSTSNTTAGEDAQNDHPQANISPSTRRPANPPTTKSPFRDAPPPYTPTPNAAPIAALQPTNTNLSAGAREMADDPYAFLFTFDTVFLIDDSGSMAGANWRETAAALKTITPICTAHDADGIDIFFLNAPDSPAHHNVTSAGAVEEIFSRVRPGRGTPTGQRLNQLLKPYLLRYEAAPETTKPMNIICITDGEPSDDVESPLISAAKKLDRLDAPAWQVGIQFFQVGRDASARKHLKQLDDELAEIAGVELRDIVDTVPFVGDEGTALTGEGILKVALGAVNRRLDRRRSRELHQ